MDVPVPEALPVPLLIDQCPYFCCWCRTRGQARCPQATQVRVRAWLPGCLPARFPASAALTQPASGSLRLPTICPS